MKITGRKAVTTAQDNAMVRFFTPVISFNLGRLLDNFTLYKVPRNKGKIRTGSVRIFSINPSSNDSMKEKATKNLNFDWIFPIIFALSGVFIASSFRSVNLFNPYTPKVIRKVIMALYEAKVLYNKPENITLKKPPVARKSEVDIMNDMKLYKVNIYFVNIIFVIVPENSIALTI